jgi:Mn-dependent DtxR family transcriptional regulator
MMDNIIILNFAEAKQPEYREKKGQGYIEFGERNDYPNYLLSLYNKSAKHNAIVRGKVNYITGNGWATKEQDAAAELFINKPNEYENLTDLTRKVSIDIEVFGGAYLEVIWSQIGGKIASLCHIDYTKLRSNKDNTQYWYKSNWEDRKEQVEVIPAYNTLNKVGKQILYIKEYRPGLDTYALPSYMGALNYIESDVEVSRHVLGNAQTGFSASKLITLPNGEPSPDEKRNIERRFTDRFSGSDGKKFILSFVSDIAKKPAVEDLGASDLTKEDFNQVDKMIQQNIFAGHQITTPSLFGVLVEGSLGTRSEIRDGYEVFKNTYVNDKQQFLESIFNKLAKINGVSTELYIKPVEPISFEFSESIIAANAPKEWILEKIGIDPNQYQNVATPEPTQAMVNEHLKGMKGREWQNFQRIIREFNKGKITRQQAVSMLKQGYGLDDDAVNTWLGDDTYEERFDDIDSTINLFAQFGENVDSYKVVARKKMFTGDLEAQELAFRDEVIDDTTDKKILDTIAKNKRIPYEDIAKALEIEKEEVLDRISKLVALDVLDYDPETKISKLKKPLKEIIDEPVKTTFLVRYEYSWDYLRTDAKDRNIKTSRPFCQRLMQLNKVYTRGEIEQISARLGYDVFARAGGWWTIPDTGIHSPKCRHTWNAVVVIKK